jgi:hypothetical protein
MKSDEYKYLEDTLLGRRGRDLEYEARISDRIEGSINQKAAARRLQLDSKTPEEREIELRQYSLRTYGSEHMRKYATPIVSDRPLGELGIEGDQIKSDPPALKGHNGDEEEPGAWCDASGRLILQNHAACPQNQVLKLR